MTAAALRTQTAWAKTLGDEAQANVEVLLATLEPYQKEIEHHFALERQKKFRGLMGTYLHWFNNQRIHGAIGDVPPAEHEAAWYAAAAGNGKSEKNPKEAA